MKSKRFCLFTLMLLMAVSATAQQSDSPQQPQRIRVVAEGMLEHKVEAQYPLEAKARHIEGDVFLRMVIDKEGNVTNLRTISGNPILAASALEAVKQWKYRPYLIKGEPVEVQSQVKIRFRL
jgi:periplasmic protein TonB